MIIKVIILFLVLIVTFTTSVYSARKIHISVDKNAISNSEELQVTASVSGFMESEHIYMKGAFFKEGSSNYFGYTNSGSDWVKNSTTNTSQRQINIGSWDKKLVVKNDPEDTGFDGSGEYKFKVGYYYTTNKGNLSSVKWSENTVPVTISFTPTHAPAKTSSTSDFDSSDNNVTYSDSEENIENVNIESNTNNLKAKSDKITTSPRTASSYAEIKPITKKVDDSESAVLGEETKDSRLAVSISAFGLFLVLFAGAILAKRRIREGKFY